MMTDRSKTGRAGRDILVQKQIALAKKNKKNSGRTDRRTESRRAEPDDEFIVPVTAMPVP